MKDNEKGPASKAMEQSERQMRAVVENAPFPIGVYMGREMRITFANASILQIWGKGNDVVGKLYADILPELENQPIFAQLDAVYTTGQSFHARNQRVDIFVEGELRPFYFNYSFTPLFDEDGNVYGVMNTGAEISDLNEAAQKIAQSERNFRNIILRAPVAMCILLGPLHVVEIANDLMIELWGKPAEAVMNKPIFEGLPDAREQGLEALLSHVYKTGETFHASERPVVLWRKGKLETVFQNFVYEPYKDADGMILGVLAISVDVTDQVLARQKIEDIVQDRTNELALANDSLLKSNAELAQFAYIASHDLQEPLRKISTYMQMLENRAAERLDEKSLHYINKIQSSSTRMQTLIRDVLAYSEVVKESDIFTKVDLNEILEGIITDYELLIEQKKAAVHYGGLPVVDAIPLQMSQLFGNLIGNALKFARKDIKPEIRISCSIVTGSLTDSQSLDPHLNYYKIGVTDNGIGFEKEFEEKIFYIFQRLHRKSEYEGTGIGLAMCKKIALNHHGDLNATGSSTNGAVFNIFLPTGQKN